MAGLTCSIKGCKNKAVMGTVEDGQFCADHVPQTDEPTK